jgi:hypothetical protein
VTFDGTNDYLTLGLSFGSDSTQVTGSFWFRRNGGNGATQVLYCAIATAGSCRFQIDLSSGNKLHLLGRDTGNTAVLDAAGSTSITDTNWHHVLFSVDLSDTAKRSIYLDGAAETPTWTTYSNTAIDFTRTSYAVGAFTNGTSKFTGDLADFYLDMGTYTDFSDAAKRELFRDANGKPVYLGSDGSAPTGTAPEVFLSGADLSAWPVNKGTGGGYTMNGTLKETTGTDGAGGIRRGLAGWWKLDELSGTTATDYSGNGNNGTLTNGPIWTPGQLGGALSFDGVNDWVDIGNPNILNPVNAISVCAWVKTPAPTPTIQMVVNKDDAGFQYVLRITGSGQMFFRVSNAATTVFPSITGNTTLLANTWYHACGTYTNAGNGAVNLYLNGIADATTVTGSITMANNNNRHVAIGNRYSALDFPFSGVIDDVRIYNRELSASDVAALYANAVCAGPAKAEGTILYNADHHVLQYCDGLTWRSIGK